MVVRSRRLVTVVRVCCRRCVCFTDLGCTLFVFLAEHRCSAHGPPRHSTAISTSFHGQPRTPHGLPRAFHGLPRNAAASSRTPWRPMALATAISTASHGKPPRHTTASRGTTERRTATPVERPTATRTDLSTNLSTDTSAERPTDTSAGTCTDTPTERPTE